MSAIFPHHASFFFLVGENLNSSVKKLALTKDVKFYYLVGSLRDVTSIAFTSIKLYQIYIKKLFHACPQRTFK